MYYVGVDLAWGEKRPTGVAVLDADGALVHVSAAQTDEDILDALKPYVDGDCLVAFDAPLIVRNETGNRPAETELNRDFQPFDAGAHPTNTSKPELAGVPRGARLAKALKLDMNPTSRRRRRAIEVYPHPATVALFRLGRTLKYKNKPGRSLEDLRSELLLLMGLVEGLAASDPSLVTAELPAWGALVEAVRTAPGKAGLRVVEDQVDAVVCAYVALFSVRHPARTTVYGSYEDGYIVTPTLPEGHRPARREPARTPRAEGQVRDGDPDQVREAVREYAARQDEITEAGAAFIALVTAVLDEAGINYLSVTGRVKTVTSFAGKAARRGPDGEFLYPDPLHDITDQMGVRVITYALSDVDAVAGLLDAQVVVLDDRDMGLATASEGRFGYASRHLLIALDAAREGQPAYELLRGRVASVQIRTVLQHAWAEFEHDIRYKGSVPPEHAREFDRRFTLAAGLLELADREFSEIRDRLRIDVGPAEAEDDDPRLDPRELAAFLAGQYPDAAWSRTDHYAWISGLLLELGITSLSELSEVLQPVNALDLNARMDYRYPPGSVRRLDDALLAAFGERYVALHGNAHREGLLRQRLGKLAG